MEKGIFSQDYVLFHQYRLVIWPHKDNELGYFHLAKFSYLSLFTCSIKTRNLQTVRSVCKIKMGCKFWVDNSPWLYTAIESWEDFRFYLYHVIYVILCIFKYFGFLLHLFQSQNKWGSELRMELITKMEHLNEDAKFKKLVDSKTWASWF